MKNMYIRKIAATDVSLLQKISKQTFFEAFSALNTPENMQKYLDEELTEAKLLSELNDPGSAFYFAELDGKVIGYLKLNFGSSQTELKDEQAVEIERIYISKEFHGQYAGQALYGKAIEVARNRKAAYVWLGVWEKNARAIRFYEKNGFVAFDKHIFVLGDDEQTDIMMRLDLRV